MNTAYPNQKPGLFTAIAVMTLTSGVINLFWGFVASATALGTFVGVICLPLTILPTILGTFEIIYAAKLLSNQPLPVQSSPSLAVFQILTFLYGNIFSMVVGILNMIFFNDITVREYFARINKTPTQIPASIAAVVRPPLPDPKNPELPDPIIDRPENPKPIRKAARK